MLQIRREIAISGNDHSHSVLFELGPKRRPLPFSVIEDGDVRPFCHQHHAGESKLGSFRDEFIDGQERLSPEVRRN